MLRGHGQGEFQLFGNQRAEVGARAGYLEDGKDSTRSRPVPPTAAMLCEPFRRRIAAMRGLRAGIPGRRRDAPRGVRLRRGRADGRAVLVLSGWVMGRRQDVPGRLAGRQRRAAAAAPGGEERAGRMGDGAGGYGNAGGQAQDHRGRPDGKWAFAIARGSDRDQPVPVLGRDFPVGGQCALKRDSLASPARTDSIPRLRRSPGASAA